MGCDSCMHSLYFSLGFHTSMLVKPKLFMLSSLAMYNLMKSSSHNTVLPAHLDPANTECSGAETALISLIQPSLAGILF